MISNICDTKKFNYKIRSRKILTLKELTISNFMYHIYIPSLEKYIYHVQYVQMLSKNICGKL